jgi:hypothetical protein
MAQTVFEAGDANAGYELVLDRQHHLVHMRLWGFWDVPLAEQFCEAILQCARDLMAKPWAILSDSQQFPAQMSEVAELRQKMMARIRLLGCRKIAILASSALTGIQFQRIANASLMERGVFQDKKAALEWLRGKH